MESTKVCVGDLAMLDVLLTETCFELEEGFFDGVGRGGRFPVAFDVEFFDVSTVLLVVLVPKDEFSANILLDPFDGSLDVVVWSGFFDAVFEAQACQADGAGRKLFFVLWTE